MIWLVILGVAVVAFSVLDFLDDLAGCVGRCCCCAFGSGLVGWSGWLFAELPVLRVRF